MEDILIEKNVSQKANYYEMWKDLARYFHEKTDLEVIIYPAEVDTNRMHIALTPSNDIKLREDGHIFFNVLVQLKSKSPISVQAKNDAMEASLALADLFRQPRGGILGGTKAPGMLYSRQIKTLNTSLDNKNWKEQFYIISQWECKLESLEKTIKLVYAGIGRKGITITDMETDEVRYL